MKLPVLRSFDRWKLEGEEVRVVSSCRGLDLNSAKHFASWPVSAQVHPQPLKNILSLVDEEYLDATELLRWVAEDLAHCVTGK